MERSYYILIEQRPTGVWKAEASQARVLQLSSVTAAVETQSAQSQWCCNWKSMRECLVTCGHEKRQGQMRHEKKSCHVNPTPTLKSRYFCLVSILRVMA